MTSFNIDPNACSGSYRQIEVKYQKAGILARILEGAPEICGNHGEDRPVAYPVVRGQRAALQSCAGCPNDLYWREGGLSMYVESCAKWGKRDECNVYGSKTRLTDAQIVALARSMKPVHP